MGPLKTINVQSTQFFKDSYLNVPDTASSPSSGDDKMMGDTVPCEEDTCLNNDVFDTQVVDDNGDSVETQPIDNDDETQIMELSGETQVIDNDEDFVDYMNTQLLDISDYQDCKWKSDKEGPQGTQMLDYNGCSIDAHLQATSGDDNIATGEKESSHFCPHNRGAKSGSLPPDDVSLNSGSLKIGFASVCTASLRAAGLAAHQTASKNADNGSSTIMSSAASELHSFEDHEGRSNAGTVGVINDMEKCSKQGLRDCDKSNVASSLARKLFLEEDVAERGSDDNVCDTREDLSRLLSCDKDVAGLSYVDSQEPGELSQANALEVVDNFLKFSVLDSDQGVTLKNAVSELVSSGGLSKGVQSVAKQITRRSTLAEGSVFDWDDNLEDEGGGEFFTKKKDVLFGTTDTIHKSCPKPRSSWHHEARVSRSVGKLRNEKGKQNLHDTLKGFTHYDLSSLDGGEKGEVELTSIEKISGNCAGQQLGFASGSLEELEVVHNAQSAHMQNVGIDMQNVGIDTQLAAEAMEVLSAGNALVNNDCSMADQGCQMERNGNKKESLKDGPSKHLKKSALKKEACLSTVGVVTRSRSKRTIKTRRQSVMGMFDGGLVYTRAKWNKLSVDDVATVDRRDSGTRTVSIDGKKTNSILEGQLNSNPLPPTKRRSLRREASISKPVVQEAFKCIDYHSSGADDASGGEHISLLVVRKRESRRRDDLDQSIAEDCSKVDGSNRNRGDLEHTSSQDNPSIDKGHTFSACDGQKFTRDSIARQTRSRKSTTQCVERPRDEKGKRFQECPHLKRLLTEDASPLSSKKQDACSSPFKPTSGSATIDVSLGNISDLANPVYSTPVNLKLPRSAVSPVCVGDGYNSPSCKKNLSLKEIMSLTTTEQSYSSPSKGLRHRRGMKNVRVLFSQHLDDDIVRQQKKILSRLDVSEASTISEATHFVADMFVRTRNMLEAIANAKPVVTHLWLESCGQANCFIDEKNYILRDAKKEKELGFSMPKSLACASQYPLLEGRRVLITPNVMPGKAVILSLVQAVHGQAVERLGRSTANHELFVLSCEEDFAVCVPLLEKGISVYSSELLLNGIITQRLEYERYRLFVANVKKTRRTLWLNKSGGKFLPVAKIR